MQNNYSKIKNDNVTKELEFRNNEMGVSGPASDGYDRGLFRQ